jgi:hypothetical protein
MDNHKPRRQKPPITELKRATARRNGKRGRGPKTAQGKAKSSRNSYKLGIFAKQIFPSGQEGLKEYGGYKNIVERIYGHYRPEGVMEELLVDKVVTESVRFARLLLYERQELSRTNPFGGQAPDRVLRYQSAINRQLTRAIEQLEELQAARNAASGTEKLRDAAEHDDAADELGDMPNVVFPCDEGQVTCDASEDRPERPNEPLTLEDLIGDHLQAPEPNGDSPRSAKSLDGVAQTIPANSISVGANNGAKKANQEKEPQPHAIAKDTEPAADFAVAEGSEDPTVAPSNPETRSQDSQPDEPNLQDIYDTL